MFSLRRWIHSLCFLPVRSRQIVNRRQPPIRLFSETLEDRTVPTTLIVNANDTAALTSDINQADSNSTAANPFIIELTNSTYSFSAADNTTNGANVLPVITAANLTIEGNGSILNANSQGRLFNVASGASLTLGNLTLTGGLAEGAGTAAEGGAIYNSGDLTLSSAVVSSNVVHGSDGAPGTGVIIGTNGAHASGGGLYVAGGTVTLNNDTFQGNHAQGGNGGYAGLGAISGNGGAASGGAVDVAGGVVTLSNDIFQGNHAVGGSGGHGFYSALGGTAAAGSGGAVNVTGGTVTLSNDTLSSNEAVGGTGGNGGRGSPFVKGPNGLSGAVGEGGAVDVAGGTVTLSTDTISNNEALGGNGGSGGTGYSYKPIGGAGPGSDGGTGGTGAGGGIYVADGTVTVSNGTNLGSNQAVGGQGGAGGHGGEGGTTDYAFIYGAGGNGGTGGNAYGGGLDVASGDVVLGDSSNTISNNQVPAGGGGAAGVGGYSSPYFVGSPGSVGTGSFPDIAANSPGFGAFLLPGDSLTSITSSVNQTFYGQSVTLTATLAAGSGELTGTVTFSDGGTSLGTVTLDASGVATLTTTTLPLGSNSITATYSGNSTFTGSSSSALAITVNPAGTTLSVSSSVNPSGPNQPVTFTAIVTADSPSTAPVDAGSVQFLIDGVDFGSPVSVNGNGVAVSLPAGSAILTVGTHTITAIYSGTANYLGSNNAYSTSVMDDAPAAYYPLNDSSGPTAQDASGNGFGGTYNGGVTFGVPGPVAGSTAIRLDGSSGYVLLPEAPFDYPTSGSTTNYSTTFETWFNAPVGSDGGVILGQNSGGNNVPAVMLGTDGLIRSSLFLGGSTITSTSTYNDGNWHLVDATYSAGSESLYVDGVLIGTQSFAETGYGSSYYYFLGDGYTRGWAGGNGGWFNFNGELAQAAIYPSALSATQVVEHLDAALGRSMTQTVTNMNVPTITVTDGGRYNGQPFNAVGGAIGVDGQTPVSGSFSYNYYASDGITPLSGAPTDAGTYYVTATFTSSDPNYASTTGGETSFVIKPPPAMALVNFASSTDPSGTGDAVSIVVEDASGNPITGLSGSDFVLGLTGVSTGTFGPVTESGDGNTYTATFTGERAGTASVVNLTIDGIPIVVQSEVTVTPGVVDVANSLVTLSASTIQLGGTAMVEVEPRDAAGNADPTGVTGVTIGLGDSKIGTLGPTTNSNGVYTATFTGMVDGVDAILTTLNGAPVGAGSEVTVSGNAVSPAMSKLTVLSATLTAGSTTTITFQAEDAKRNKETAGGLTVAFKLTSTKGHEGVFGPVTDNGNGTYSVTFSSTLAGSDSITATIAGVKGSPAAVSVKVVPGPYSLAESVVTASATTVKAGTRLTLTLQPEDAYGNKVNQKGLSVGFVVGSQTLIGTYKSNGTYTASYTATTVGTLPLTTTIDGQAVTSSSAAINVTPGAASGATSYLTFPNGNSVTLGQTIQIILQAVDLYGNLETAGGASVAFEVERITGSNGTGSFGPVKYIGNGQYEVAFKGTAAGALKVTAKVAGVILKTAPLLVTVEN